MAAHEGGGTKVLRADATYFSSPFDQVAGFLLESKVDNMDIQNDVVFNFFLDPMGCFKHPSWTVSSVQAVSRSDDRQNLAQ